MKNGNVETEGFGVYGEAAPKIGSLLLGKKKWIVGREGGGKMSRLPFN